jgi:predicted histidine transporter YuiF (NhaC family)
MYCSQFDVAVAAISVNFATLVALDRASSRVSDSTLTASVSMAPDGSHDLSILCIEPCIDDFSCLGNNRLFGTFLKRGGTFRQWR